MQKYNVLIFPCGTEIANEVINSLANNKYFKTKFASSEIDSYCTFNGQEVHYLPYVTDKSFENHLMNIIKNEKIDFIVPAHDDVAFALSQIEKIETKVIGQSRFINELVRFKDKTYKYFKNIIPIADIYKDENEIIFPCFIKPKKGQGSQNAFLVKNKQDFEYYKTRYRLNEFIFMEYLSQEEFTIDCFSHKGNLLYAGGRTREKTTRGISVKSTFISDKFLNQKFHEYANIISQKLNMHGVWFYQMKLDKEGKLKLLEIGPRVSGTMMLNRARGVNFIELALYQKLGYDVEVIYNDIEVSLGRALVPKYKTNIEYKRLYVDFDDTLLIDEKYINSDLMKLIFQVKNENKEVILITKNKKNNLSKILHKFGITNLFDDIIHIKDSDKKINYMIMNSLLIDDSFAERKEAIENGIYAIGIDNINVLFK